VSGVAGRAGCNVFRTFRWRHWFVGIQNGKAVSQGRLHCSRRRDGGCLACREKREAKQADDKFDDQMETAPSRLLSLPSSNRIGQGFAPLAPRLDGVSSYQYVLAKISLVGRRSAEPPSKRDRFSYKKRSMIGPSLLIVAAGHNFRLVMIALSRA